MDETTLHTDTPTQEAVVWIRIHSWTPDEKRRRLIRILKHIFLIHTVRVLSY